MVARLRVVEVPVTADDWLQAADDDVLGCRGQGHHFPKLRRSRSGNVAKGITVHPPENGVYQIDATCPDCGTIRTELTLPGGDLADPVRYRYVYPFYGPGDPRNYQPPKGVKVRRRSAAVETRRRVGEDALRASAQLA